MFLKGVETHENSYLIGIIYVLEQIDRVAQLMLFSRILPLTILNIFYHSSPSFRSKFTHHSVGSLFVLVISSLVFRFFAPNFSYSSRPNLFTKLAKLIVFLKV